MYITTVQLMYNTYILTNNNEFIDRYQPKYTLVLELTGVLVHPDWTVSFHYKTVNQIITVLWRYYTMMYAFISYCSY